MRKPGKPYRVIVILWYILVGMNSPRISISVSPWEKEPLIKKQWETKGRQGSSSRNYDVLGRELLTPDETRKLDNSECILLIRGCDPIIDKKYNTFAHSDFRKQKMAGLRLISMTEWLPKNRRYRF